MGGNKHKQTKKKSARVVKESKTKKGDLGDSEGAGDQTNSCVKGEPGRCCLPAGLFRCLSPEVRLSEESQESDGSVRMVCSSADCSLAQHLTHPKCFEKLEQAAVMALKNIKGRAREWSDKERYRYLWHDRAYELIYAMFKCPCGHGFLRKDLDTFKAVAAATPTPAAQGTEKRKNLPKLNVPSGLCSQKGIGGYFKDQNSHEIMTINKKSQPSKPKEDLQEDAPAKTKTIIPGLTTEGKVKPQKLNIDLDALKSPMKIPIHVGSKDVAINPLKAQNPMPVSAAFPNIGAVSRNIVKVPDPIARPVLSVSKYIPPALRFPTPSPLDQSSRKSSICSNIDEDFSQTLLPGDIFESDGEDNDQDQGPNSYAFLDFGRVTSTSRLPSNSPRDQVPSPSPWQTVPVSRRPTVVSPRGNENLEDSPNLVRKNIELLQQNVGLREENVALKMTTNQMMEDRKKILNALSEKIEEARRRESQMKQLYDTFIRERNSTCFLRNLLLEPISSNGGTGEEERGLPPPVPEFPNVLEELDEDFSDSGVSENDLYQVSQKLDELDTSSKSLATHQDRTEEKVENLDHKVQKLAAENVKFRMDIEKMRNYLRFFDMF